MEPLLGSIQGISLDLDAIKICESHLLQNEQLVSHVASNFENARVSGNLLKKSLIHFSACDPVVATIEVVQTLGREGVAIGVLAPKVARPGAYLLCIWRRTHSNPAPSLIISSVVLRNLRDCG